MGRPLVKPEFYTYADYYSWPDVIRGELIEGRFHDMTPAPAHQRVVGNLFLQIGAFFRGRHCRAFVAPFDVRLPKAGEEEGAERNVVQPDILVICDPGKLDERGCRGAPDWIIEVLSDGTREKDLSVKRDLYERSGVTLYWTVSPRDRSVSMLRLDGSRYVDDGSHAGKGRQPVAKYPGLEIDWDWVFEPD